MDFIWIVLGVIYLLYMCISEKPKTTISVLKVMSPIIILAVVAVIMDRCGIGIADVILPVAMLIGLPILFIWSRMPNDPDRTRTDRRNKVDKWFIFMRKDYPRIRIEDIELLVDSNKSPLNSEKLQVTSIELYTWLCNHYSWKLNELSDETLGKMIGMSLDDLPLDDNLNMYRGKQKLRALVINKILNEQYGGLEYNDTSYGRCPYVVVQDEYTRKLDDLMKNYNSEHHKRDTS